MLKTSYGAERLMTSRCSSVSNAANRRRHARSYAGWVVAKRARDDARPEPAFVAAGLALSIRHVDLDGITERQAGREASIELEARGQGLCRGDPASRRQHTSLHPSREVGIRGGRRRGARRSTLRHGRRMRCLQRNQDRAQEQRARGRPRPSPPRTRPPRRERR